MKNTTLKTLVILIVLVVCVNTGLYSKKYDYKKLAPKFQNWYKVVYHLITPLEKDIFFKLRNDRERETFVELFWKQRDPSKGTPENEYKDEIYKRYKHVMKYFKFGSTRPAWLTDRGRIYMILGAPVSINAIDKLNIYPVQIWDYYGSPAKGLPTHFNVVFYRKYGGAEWEIYIPAVDGPSALLQSDTQTDLTNNQTVYEKLWEIEPEVARVSLTLIPDEKTHGYSPSMRDPILISNIHEYPKKTINTSYAKNFVNYKGIVKVTAFTSYINNKSLVTVFRNNLLNLNFVHFAVHPSRLSVGFSDEKDQYYFNYRLTVVLLNKKNDEQVLKYSKNYSFYFSKAELETKISQGMILADAFPVVDGAFHMKCIVENLVNNEITFVEREINTVKAGKKGLPVVSDPVLAYRVNKSGRTHFSSFNIDGNFVNVEPNLALGFKETPFFFFTLNRNGFKGDLLVDVKLKDFDGRVIKEFPQIMGTSKSYKSFVINAGKLKTSDYRVELYVKNKSGIVLGSRELTFMVSPHGTVSHAPIASKKLSVANRFSYFLMVASQFEQLKKPVNAEKFYKKALAVKPGNPSVIKQYSAFLLHQKNYKKAAELIEPLKFDKKELFDYYKIKGTCHYYSGEYNSAVNELVKANNIYDSDIKLLNLLGYSLIRVDNKKEALKALSASLTILSSQPVVKKIVRKLREDLKNRELKK